MEYLVETRWIEGEAGERGIVVTLAQARESVAESFPDRKDLTAFLRRSQRAERDLLLEHRTDLRWAEIQLQIAQPAALSVTPEQIDAYVAENPRTEPERRAVRMIVTTTRRAAREARRALAKGLTWRSAGRRYARERGATTGGARVSIEPGDLDDDRLERAVFAAAQRRFVGPLRTDDGYVLFKVVRITPERPTPQDVQRATAEEVLASEAQQAALDAFQAEFTAKWRQRTTCAPTHAVASVCGQP